MQVNVIRAARGKGCPNIPPQHLVFSIGLMDYLADAVFIEVSPPLHCSAVLFTICMPAIQVR